jgi:hypothetical protein
MKRWTSFLLVVAAVTIVAPPVSGQGLRAKIGELFIFGPGDDPLFLAGTAGSGVPAVQIHADHFIPSAVESNGTLINFLTTAISSTVSNIPISATSSGLTFRFEGGLPVPTSTSPGPIFAERAQTLGRGRVLVGASVNVFNFKSLRGVDLDNLRLNFAHVNVDSDACDLAVGQDCAPQGVPVLENDFIALDLDLNIDVIATLFVLTYGIHDRVDIGVAIPLVSTSLQGFSRAEIVPFGGPTASHFFAGTETNPQLIAETRTEGTATGLGDVAARLKIAVSESENAGFSILADARFATGDEEDLLGSGETSMRGLGIVSAQFANFSPHANVGYLYRAGDFQNDAFLATIGFDHVLAPWATLAVDFVSELQVGTSVLTLPDPVEIEEPFFRTVELATIPNRRDDVISGSIGFKFVTPSGLTLIANSLWPLNRGGMRTNVSWTAGLEYNF